jgi:EAL domain-containing protein (putative c-di-GMP-specific phosphodiesterase class I)
MCCVFDEAIDAEIKDDLILEREMQFALQDNQFELYYQPIWDTRAQKVVGAEALARWRHPTRGMIPPDNFILLAERTGFIIELGRWALETACREASSWAEPISVSVNVSPAQLHRKELVREVRDLLTTIGFPPSRLKLEITEGQLLEETPEMIATVTALRNLGVRLALDDFGTAHSSLSTMVCFPFTDIKIDRQFTNGIAQDERSRSLFEAILQVCRIMNMECVAEGVETEAQLKLLQELGCTYAQGYLIGRPEPREVIRRKLWESAASRQVVA